MESWKKPLIVTIALGVLPGQVAVWLIRFDFRRWNIIKFSVVRRTAHKSVESRFETITDITAQHAAW